jgi:hypothetical protein
LMFLLLVSIRAKSKPNDSIIKNNNHTYYVKKQTTGEN